MSSVRYEGSWRRSVPYSDIEPRAFRKKEKGRVQLILSEPQNLNGFQQKSGLNGISLSQINRNSSNVPWFDLGAWQKLIESNSNLLGFRRRHWSLISLKNGITWFIYYDKKIYGLSRLMIHESASVACLQDNESVENVVFDVIHR